MKIKKEYLGCKINDPKIGRRVEVNEKNLPTLLQYGHYYLLDNDTKIKPKRSKRDSSNDSGNTNVGDTDISVSVQGGE
jgi:hypothetical protein